jgi:uncharacterized protein YggT (Ycf19 family)
MDALILTLNAFCALGYCLLIAAAVVPWLPLPGKNGIMGLLRRLTDPLLVTIRLGLPPDKIGFDFSPFAGIIIIWLLRGFIIHYILGG